MMRYGYRYGYNMMAGGGAWLIFLVLIIVIAFVAFRLQVGKNNIRNFNNNSALEILEQRYAMGEISEEQYRKMRDTLMNRNDIR